MARTFKIRRTPPKVWAGFVIVIFAFVLVAWRTDSYWGLLPIVFPVLVLLDELFARIVVQDNGDVWFKRGFSGSVKAYGVIRIVRRKKSYFHSHVIIYYTKGFISFDPADEDEFIRYVRERNPRALYAEENH